LLIYNVKHIHTQNKYTLTHLDRVKCVMNF